MLMTAESVPSPGWDPGQYLQYADERGRPFFDLIDRIPVAGFPGAQPRRVIDLGCGPGNLTRQLVDRWPSARITGVDSSPDMVRDAQQLAVDGRLDFQEGNLPSWEPDGPVDVVVANAVLQWVPGHLDLIARIAGWLTAGGAFAFQVPDNFTSPSHLAIRDLRQSDKWRDRLGAGADRGAGVATPEAYLEALESAGLRPDVWHTTYLHVLHGDRPVLEWVKGTALRPVLTELADDPIATAEFLDECGALLDKSYLNRPNGVIFPFRRIFAVGVGTMKA
jgi:trans-aconitate 2-methyltransferase